MENRIGDEGAGHIAESLKQNMSLQVLEYVARTARTTLPHLVHRAVELVQQSWSMPVT